MTDLLRSNPSRRRRSVGLVAILAVTSPGCRAAPIASTTVSESSGSSVTRAGSDAGDAHAGEAGAPEDPSRGAVSERTEGPAPPLLTCTLRLRETPLRLTLDAQGATLRAVDPARAISCRAQIRRVRDCRGCARNFAVIEFAPFACTGESLVADRGSLRLEPYPRIDRATLMGLGSGGMEACEIERIEPAGLDPLPGERPDPDDAPASGS